MTTGQKIAALRRERGMTQDALAEALSVTRQAVSKWEADAALPETGKLLPLARLFGCTVDYLLGGAAAGEGIGAKTAAETEIAAGEAKSEGQPVQGRGVQQAPAHGKEQAAAQEGGCYHAYWGARRCVWAADFEYKSERTLFGLPLVHINGKWGGTAKGVVAVGFKACGVVSVGFLSMGVFSAGCLSLGAVSLGALALGVLTLGAVSVGLLLALGAVAAGFVAYGAAAFGGFAAGAFACAKYVAVGDYACALIPLAKTFAWGGAVHDFYFLFTAGMPGLQVGYFEGGALVEGGAALPEACAQYVPAWLQWLAEAFCRLRLY